MIKKISGVKQRLDLKTIGGLFAIPILLLSLQAIGSPELSGEELFKKRCSLCHSLPDPAQIPPEGWEKRLNMMAPLARLKRKQKAEVLQYLQNHARAEVLEAVAMNDRALVEEKCSTCHSLGRVVLESFDGNAGRHVLDRMQSYAGTDHLSDDELKRILGYLQNGKDLAMLTSPEQDATPTQVFRIRCSACHTLERVIALIGANKTSESSWVHIVSRMQAKAPEWISPEESELLLAYIQSLEIENNNP